MSAVRRQSVGLLSGMVSEQRCDKHGYGCEEPYGPYDGAPRGQAESVGRNVENPRPKIDVGAGRSDGGRLAAHGDDDHGDGKQDQPFEMVVHRALEAAGGTGQLDLYVARGRGGFATDVHLRRDRVEAILDDLKKACEGEDGEFAGHLHIDTLKKLTICILVLCHLGARSKFVEFRR